MLLQRLKEYADERMKLPPPLYSETPIRYVIELNEDGTLRSRTPTDTSDPKDPKAKRGQRRLAPQVQRTVGIKPLLLADKADYTLGIGSETAKPSASRPATRPTRRCCNAARTRPTNRRCGRCSAF